jgi:hypothetical protein
MNIAWFRVINHLTLTAPITACRHVMDCLTATPPYSFNKTLRVVACAADSPHRSAEVYSASYLHLIKLDKKIFAQFEFKPLEKNHCYPQNGQREKLVFPKQDTVLDNLIINGE